MCQAQYGQVVVAIPVPACVKVIGSKVPLPCPICTLDLCCTLRIEGRRSCLSLPRWARLGRSTVGALANLQPLLEKGSHNKFVILEANP